jgi:hypothetical protein
VVARSIATNKEGEGVDADTLALTVLPYRYVVKCTMVLYHGSQLPVLGNYGVASVCSVLWP